MPLDDEKHKRGEELYRGVKELAGKESDPALRLSVVFMACFDLAMKEGLTPSGFLDFCEKTIAGYLLQADAFIAGRESAPKSKDDFE